MTVLHKLCACMSILAILGCAQRPVTRPTLGGNPIDWRSRYFEFDFDDEVARYPELEGLLITATEYGERRGEGEGSVQRFIEPGDLLGVFVEEEPEFCRVYTASSNPWLDLPLLGEVVILGRTPTALQDELRRRMAVYLRDPAISVLHSPLPEPGVNVGRCRLAFRGEILHVPISVGTRLVDVILPKLEDRSRLPNSHVRIIKADLFGEDRPGIVIADLFQLGLNGDATENVQIDDGDMIFVYPRWYVGDSMHTEGMLFMRIIHKMQRENSSLPQ